MEFFVIKGVMTKPFTVINFIRSTVINISVLKDRFILFKMLWNITMGSVYSLTNSSNTPDLFYT